MEDLELSDIFAKNFDGQLIHMLIQNTSEESVIKSKNYLKITD